MHEAGMSTRKAGGDVQVILDEVSIVTKRLLKRCGDLTYPQAWEAACRVVLMRKEIDQLQHRQEVLFK